MTRFSHTILSLAALAGTASAASPSADAEISSQFLTRGESAIFQIIVHGDPPERMPVLPEVKNFNITQIGGMQTRLAPDRSRRLDYYFNYRVSSYTEGHYVIPSAEVTVAGEKVRTQPVDVDILSENSLKRQEVQVGGRTVAYSAFFQTPKKNPYVGEKIPVELKVYYPADRTQLVQDWGMPDFERDGLSAWRFRPQQNNLGSAKIGARDFSAASYPSTLSANRQGKVSIGPATLLLQTYQAETGTDEAANLTIPPLELEARPLPPGAPDTFENAIGNFKLDVNVGETEVHEGDPVTVTLIVSGSGNLDTLKPPRPLNADGWKLYDPIPNQRGEERTEMSGVVSFTQLIRPLKLQSAVPAFTFSFFNPATEKYETLASNAVALKVLPSTTPPVAGIQAPPKAMAMPVEQMSDILGIITSPKGLLPAGLKLPESAWQMVPALLALGLLSRIVMTRIAAHSVRDPDAVARARELREIEKVPDDRSAFYRAVGHFAERWLGNRTNPDVAEILARRDEVAFRPDAANMKIDRAERTEVLRKLKKLALPVLAFWLALSPPASRADDAVPAGPDTPQKAYEESRYSDAAKLWLQSGPYDRLSGDVLYNIGDAAYRLGSPGEAALYYRRALQRDGAHPEARQNLRFVERKFGSITVQRADYQHALGQVSLQSWKNLIWAGGWLFVIGVLVFAASFRNLLPRLAGVVSLCLAPLFIAAGSGAVHYYPDDARFAPVSEQMVVVSEQSVVRTDASRTSPHVIDAPAGSLCRLVARSGEWTYVEFANDTRGWLPREDVEPLVPQPGVTPEAPKIHPRTSADGSNA